MTSALSFRTWTDTNSIQTFTSADISASSHHFHLNFQHFQQFLLLFQLLSVILF